MARAGHQVRRTAPRKHRPGIAEAHGRSLPSIIDKDSYLTALHERGHLAAPCPGSKLKWEIVAWRYARERALVWDAECQEGMVRALQSHVNTANRDDVLDVIAVEQFCSAIEFKRERQRRLEASLTDERARLDAALLGRPCERCQRGPATTLHVDRPHCRACADDASDEAKSRIVDAEIKRQRRLRAQMRARQTSAEAV